MILYFLALLYTKVINMRMLIVYGCSLPPDHLVPPSPSPLLMPGGGCLLTSCSTPGHIEGTGGENLAKDRVGREGGDQHHLRAIFRSNY